MSPLNIPPSVFELAALVKPKPKRNYNPFHYIWTGMQHVGYFFAPANECVYCWIWRMWLFGFVVGMQIMYWFPWVKI